MRFQNKQLELRNVIKFWLLITASITPLVYVPIGGKLDSYFSKFLFLILIFIFLLTSLLLFRKQAKHFIVFDIETKLLLAFYILLILSVFFALNRTTAIFGSFYRFEGLLTLTIYYLIFLCSRKINVLDKKFIFIMLLSGTFISIHGIMQVYGIDPIPSHYYSDIMLSVHRYSSYSSMGQPNHLGTYLVLLIPFTIYLYYVKNSTLGFLFYNIMFYALLCTNTRGAWIGAFVSLFSYFMFTIKYNGIKKTEKKKILSFAISSLLLLTIYTLTSGGFFEARFSSIFSDMFKVVTSTPDSTTAGSGRIYIWMKAVELIKLRPLFGIGIDNLSVALRTFYEKDIIATCGDIGFANWSKAHNEYLQTAVTTGIPSLFIYLSLVIIIIKKAISRIKYSDIYLPLVASFVGFYVAGFFNNSVIMNAYILWMLLGFACSNEVIVYGDK